MAAGRRDQQGSLGLRLAAHLGQIGSTARLAGRDLRQRCRQRRSAGLRGSAGQQGHRLRQGVGQGQVGATHPLRFGRVGPRHQQCMTCPPAMQRRQQQARHRLDLAGQPQFAIDLPALQITLHPHLPGGDQDGQRDSQVETTALFGQIGRGQIDGDATGRQFIAAVGQRRPHPLFALAHHRGGQTHDGEAGQTAAQMQFNAHQRCGQPDLRPAVDLGKTHGPSLDRNGRRSGGRSGLLGLRLELTHALFELLDHLTGALEHPRLRVELFARGQIELGQPGTQHVAEIGLEVVLRRAQGRRHGIEQSAGKFFDAVCVHRSTSVSVSTELVRQNRACVHNCALLDRVHSLCPHSGALSCGTDSANLLSGRWSFRIQACRWVLSNAAFWPVLCEMYIMKMITAVVRPFKLDELRHAIAQLGVQGVTVTEVHEAEFGPRVKLEIAVDDSILEPVLEAIANVSRTGKIGDGKILVGNLDQAIRIRTGETGTAAT